MPSFELNEPPAPRFEPVRIVDIDLAQPLPTLTSSDSPRGQTYRRALLLVRLHGAPLGLVEVEFENGSIACDALAAAVWSKVSRKAAQHLAHDGVEPPRNLMPSGIGSITADLPPPCAAERTHFLESAPDLTVLIPSRERPDRLRRCIDSIIACEYPSARLALLVVDNAPLTTLTRSLIESYAERANIRYLREDVLGSASARNRGLQEVQTDIVVMTDDDTLVDRHWLTEMARAFAAFPEAAAVSGLLVPMELDSPAQVWFEDFGGFSRGFDRRIFNMDEHWPSDEPLYPWTAGVFGTANNFAFRTASIREIGGFDPALGNGTPALGGVDTEIMLRTVLSGYTIVYEPRALVHHAHRVDYAALRKQIYSYGSGLTAVWLKTLLANPHLSIDFARKIGPGLRFALRSDSPKNSRKRAGYPSELTWLELRGMVYGPVAYARSRRKYGPHPVPRAIRPRGGARHTAVRSR